VPEVVPVERPRATGRQEGRDSPGACGRGGVPTGGMGDGDAGEERVGERETRVAAWRSGTQNAEARGGRGETSRRTRTRRERDGIAVLAGGERLRLGSSVEVWRVVMTIWI
jgi:hypothetical protein